MHQLDMFTAQRVSSIKEFYLYVLSPAPTGAPEELTSTLAESRSLTLMWGTVFCLGQNGPITGYSLRYSNGTAITDTTGEGSRQYVVTGLIPYTTYFIQVAAINTAGTGTYSDPPLIVETLQDSEHNLLYLQSMLLHYYYPVRACTAGFRSH